jgi:AraC-like DNA-binding protein
MNTKQYPKIYLYQRVVKAKLFIDNYWSEKIDLDNISDEAYFSKFHFIRLFKSIYGKTPHQYLTKVRMERSKQLLQQGRPVSEVCFLAGYDSISSFSALFTKTAGKTPSEYLAAHKKRKNEIQTQPMAFVPQCYAFMHGWTENSNFEEAKP